MTALSYVDGELAVRAWARQAPALQAAVGTQTFFALPPDYDLDKHPRALTVQRIGGAPDPHSPLDTLELQLTCWGRTKADAAAVQTAVFIALHSQLPAVLVVDGQPVRLLDGRISGALFAPDLSTRPPTARYVVTALVAIAPHPQEQQS